MNKAVTERYPRNNRRLRGLTTWSYDPAWSTEMNDGRYTVKGTLYRTEAERSAGAESLPHHMVGGMDLILIVKE